MLNHKNIILYDINMQKLTDKRKDRQNVKEIKKKSSDEKAMRETERLPYPLDIRPFILHSFSAQFRSIGSNGGNQTTHFAAFT